ncbi:MAG: glycosyltransferase [Alloprevotella sp.]
MNILHLNTGLEGGAALCARRIHKALLQQDIVSQMLVARGAPTSDVTVAKPVPDRWYANPLGTKMKHLLMRTPFFWDREKMDILLRQSCPVNSKAPYCHHPYTDFTSLWKHPLIEWADIIHLHWVSGFVDYPSFFSHVRKPIVWTLHDMNPLLGLMHYESEHQPLPSYFQKLAQHCCTVKRQSLRGAKIHPVAISNFMAQACRESSILGRYPLTVIPNGVETSVFKPSHHLYSLQGVDLANSTVFLFSSIDIWDARKGLQRVIEALEKVDCDDKVLVVVGSNPSQNFPRTSFPVICVGLVKDDAFLATLYSTADFFLHASYDESFGQTLVEAMACGTPVIATRCGISPELVSDMNGVLSEGFDSDALANAIAVAICRKYDAEVIRQHIIENYDYSVIASKYVQHYRNILKR